MGCHTGVPDYFHQVLASALPAGRYLSEKPVDAGALGPWVERVRRTPYFPFGLTYGEFFSSSRTDRDLIQQRQAAQRWTFGTGLAAGLLGAALDRGVTVLVEHPVDSVVVDGGTAVGATVRQPDGSSASVRGSVVLATSGYDWSPDLVQTYALTPPDELASIAPTSLTGDGLELARAAGGWLARMPPEDAAYAVGYRLREPTDTDPGFRTAYECMLPHAFDRRRHRPALRRRLVLPQHQQHGDRRGGPGRRVAPPTAVHDLRRAAPSPVRAR